MKIADLFARLSIRPDNTGKVDKFLGGIKGQLTGIIGLSAVAFGVKDALNFAEALTRLEIASSGLLGTADELEKQILDVSSATGAARDDVLAGTAAFISLTGDADAASKSMELFAKVQQGTGAQMEDIAKTAAALQQNLKIDPKDFEQAFSILISGGKKGAIELKDAAGVLASLTPLMEQFQGGAGVEGLAELGASLQLARQGFGSSKETATGLKALFVSLQRNAKKFEKVGVKVFDKDPKTGLKTLRNFKGILADIATSDLAKDSTEAIAAFGSIEAFQAFTQLTKTTGALDDLAESTLNATDVADDNAKFQKSNAAKINKAWTKIKNSLTKVFGVVVRVIGFMIDHFDALAIATAALGIAFIILKAKMIAAAIAAAAAWIIALLPFVLLAALIAGLIFVAVDLWNVFSGGESVFTSVREAAVEALSEIFLWIENLIDKWKEFEALSFFKDKFLLKEKTSEFARGIQRDLRAERFLSPEAKEAARKRRVGALGLPSTEDIRREQESRGVFLNPETTINLTVPEGTDAEGVANAVDRKLHSFLDGISRTVVDAMGQ